MKKKIRNLYYWLYDSIRNYSVDFAFESRGNPSIIRLNGSRYSIHLSYIHGSGNTRESGELRKQVSGTVRDYQDRQLQDGCTVAFVGVDAEASVFVAWDPKHVLSLQAPTTASIYAKQFQIDDVKSQSKFISVYKFPSQFLNEERRTIAMPTEALGFYLENLTQLHRLPDDDRILADLVREYRGLSHAEDHFPFEVNLGSERLKFRHTSRSYRRDPRFRSSVLSAYGNSCCICRKQLGIVEAAHIVPHSEDCSSNEVANGLALCAEHHKLYDGGLLLPGPSQEIYFNELRAEFLYDTNQACGLEEVRQYSKRSFAIPNDSQLQPKDSYLEKGMVIRIGE